MKATYRSWLSFRRQRQIFKLKLVESRQILIWSCKSRRYQSVINSSIFWWKNTHKIFLKKHSWFVKSLTATASRQKFYKNSKYLVKANNFWPRYLSINYWLSDLLIINYKQYLEFGWQSKESVRKKMPRSGRSAISTLRLATESAMTHTIRRSCRCSSCITKLEMCGRTL